MSSLSFVVQTGPDAGRRFAIPAGQITTIGRGEGADVRLLDNAVSRHHLSVQPGPDPTILHVRDMTGVNPAWTVRAGERIVLGPGDQLALGDALTVGNTTLVLQQDSTSSSSAGDTGNSGSVGSGTLELEAGLEGRSGRRLAALAALGEKLARCGSLQAVFRESTAWAVEALPASRALLLSPDGTDILAAAADGMVADLALSEALLQRVRSEQRAFLVRDIQQVPEIANRRSVKLRGIAGAMAAPAANLVLYAEWQPRHGARHRYDEEALLLLICAAHLVSALGENAVERSQLQAAARRVRDSRAIPRLIGSSAALRRLQVFVERVAATRATVLLNGESGTGKELVAGLVHALSERAGGPLVAINCAAIPEGLLESELFGHEKGAFTGAVARHDGVFTRAHQGTLFLDEIGEMSLSAQTRLLRVLETRRFSRVGGTEELEVDVRLIAATNRDLSTMVAEERFRQDLLYRLSVIHTRLPALRERPEDIPALVRHFADGFGDEMGRRIHAIAPDALEILERYRWPGNVRELRNVIERALVLGDGPTLELDDLPPELLNAGSANVVPRVPVPVQTLAEMERDAIARALHATHGNKARAAALLGIDRTTLYRKLKESEH